ncbi:MAG TPA: ANTAR domain-containing protein, partial [Nocardioidaceae bacterium]|nr:ANTAR domain-containing protein [Nocardioidaceae bacterium]
CVDVARTAGPALEDDLKDSGAIRWPWFSPAAVGLGAGAAYAWPVQVGATSLGVLGLYRRSPGALPTTDRSAAVAVADAAAIVLLDAPEIGSPDALVWIIADDSRFRAEVHQATGMLTVQLQLDVLDAFARLCAAAYADGRSIAELSHDIVNRRTRLDG